MNAPVRILHFTEAMASGTLHVLSQLSRAQAQDGMAVHILYSTRPDTPSEQELDRLLPTPITRSRIASTTFSFLTIGALKLVAAIRSFKPDIVHLHSSKAGAMGRIVCRLLRQGNVFYSPHGFSFLRSDVSKATQRLFLLAEQLLAKLGGHLIACSESEAELARGHVRTENVSLAENAIDLSHIKTAAHINEGKIHVVCSGRLCYQKAPWRFFELAQALASENAQFTWIGGGDESLIPHSNHVRITGWVSRDAALETLSNADIYVLLSLWEGMPLVLIEAQAAGLPAVVSDIPGCREVVQPKRTGFICASDEDAVARTRQLIRDSELRLCMAKEARAYARKRFDAKRLHADVLNLYGNSQLSPAKRNWLSSLLQSRSRQRLCE